MDSSTSVLDSLRTVEFRLGLKGYNVDEVDEYLEKAAVEATSLKEQLRQTTDRLRQATERIAELEGGGAQDRRATATPELVTAAVQVAAPVPPPAPAPAPTSAPVPVNAQTEELQQTLLLAQRFVEQAKRESEAEASAVVTRAEDQAHAIVSQAEEHARRLAMDSEQRLREEVHRLESARSQLASDVESLGRYLDAERSRLRGSLDEIGKWLDEKLQPNNTVAALRARPPASAEITAGSTRTSPRPTSSPNRPSISGGSNGGSAAIGGDFGSGGDGSHPG